MPVTPGFTAFVVEQLDRCGPITTKRMFGGVGIYSGDTFFAIIDNDVLYLKVDDSTRPDFERDGCQPFRPYGDDRESMSYYSVPVAVLEDAGELGAWGRKAIAVALRTRRSRPAEGRPRPAQRSRRSQRSRRA
jgi:DNA transformation protein